MKLYEYEGKILFRKVGIKTPNSLLVPPANDLPKEGSREGPAS